MNCTQVQELLPGFVYCYLSPEETAATEKHLATCAACRQEHAELVKVHQLLDASPGPEVAVDLPRLYSRSLELQRRRMRHWRRLAGAAVAAAAALLLMILLPRLEVRMDADQLVVRWGKAPVPQEVTPVQPPAQGPVLAKEERFNSASTEREIQLLRDLVHALAENMDARELQHRGDLVRLGIKIDELQGQSNRRWTDAKKEMDAMYTERFVLNKKGEKP